VTGHTVYFRRIPEYKVEGMPLGRHVRIDSRDAAYPYVQLRAYNTLQDQLWPRKIPILNQLQVGACVGNAGTGNLGSEPFFDTLPAATQLALNEKWALGLYSDCETLDGDGPYPPNDNGSSGPSCGQVLKNRGDIAGYLHITSAQDIADALQDGPVIAGYNWYDSFDSPDSNGLISISPNAQVRGGHETEIRGVKVQEKVFSEDNSWGTGWGNAGSFEIGWDTIDRLLSEQGDCTKFVPNTEPAPTPVPVQDADHMFWLGGPGQQLPGGLMEWAGQHRTREDLAQLKMDAEAWAVKKGLPV
jgi:hypothetical protein